jgi:D-alanyl-D-alanine carboxypeptidase
MAGVSFGARHGFRCGLFGLAAVAAALTIGSDAADARYQHRVHVRYVHATARLHRHAHAEEYAPPSASIVVDGNSGAILQASNPDALRHPASLTKIMTLYLLFERLDSGRIKLDSALKVSAHASEQAPTKLDLKPGQTIAVEDAIKGIVTKSANDAAVTVAENLGGDEETFAKLMTQKAHALGMTHTTYVNASGLPDDDQLTTARDQALLGRAIQERFPHYYKYFATESFVYRGEAMRNHNHLLGAIEGVDGIKTGFTRASGFNLVTSVHRDGRYIVAVVLGGPSASVRDAHMRELIVTHLKEAALRRTAPTFAEASAPREEAQPLAFAKSPLNTASLGSVPVLTPSRADSTPTATAASGDAHPAANDPIRPLLVKTITFRTAPVQTASLAPMPVLVPVAAPAPQPAASTQPVALPSSARTQPLAQTLEQHTVMASADPAAEAKDAAAPAQSAKTETLAPPDRGEAAKVEPAKVETASSDHAVADEPQSGGMPRPAAARAHGGWLIQIGAYEGEDEARQHLTAAQLALHNALAAADPFTERVQKGDKAFYRARFAGFDKATAETACKQLKRSDFECMALKD